MGTSTRRTWVKLHVTGWLHGTIRWQLTSEERGVWADFLALAGELGHEGLLVDNDNRPVPRDYMAHLFNIKRSLLDRVIKKSIEEGRLIEVEGRLLLANWTTYQSEYRRQKPYRNAAK